MSARNYSGNDNLAIYLIRAFLTIVMSAIAVISGGIVAALGGVLVLGFQAYDASFLHWPWGWAAILSVAFYSGCGIVAAIVTWSMSAAWTRRFIARQCRDEPDVYSEVGGARFPVMGGLSMNVTWPLAQFHVSRQQLEIKAVGFRFSFEQEAGIHLRRRCGIMCCGIIITDADDRTCTFWSWNVGGLIEKLRSCGWVVEEERGDVRGGDLPD